MAIVEIEGTHDVGLPNVLIGHGIRGDLRFEGRFDDELFGVFATNDSISRIVRVFDILPTPRWNDYTLRVERIRGDSVIVAGKGATYGDQVIRRSYALRP